MTSPKFSLNQIVRGRVAGTFVVLNRVIDASGEYAYDLKEVHPVTFDQPRRGGIRLSESDLRPVA